MTTCPHRLRSLRPSLGWARLFACLLPWVVAASCSQKSGPTQAQQANQQLAAELAHLEALHGSVKVRFSGQSQDVPGVANVRLDANDLVITGSDGETDVVFAGNNRVHLGPNGSLLLHAGGGVAAEVGGVVLSGRATVSSGGSGVGLNIGTPLGMAKLRGDKVAVLEVDLSSGLHLTTGEVVLARPDQLEVLPLTLGQTLQIDALPVLLPGQQMIDVPGLNVANKTPQPPAVPAKLVRKLGAPSRQLHGSGAWAPLGTGELLHEGDHLRLRRRERAELALSEGMDLEMRGAGEMVLGRSEETAAGRRARYTLQRGQAQLRITTLAGQPVQEAKIAGLPVILSPGAKTAKVDVDQADANTAHLVVRYGKLKVGDAEVEAGQAIDIAAGTAQKPYPAFNQPVQLSPGQPAVLYVQNKVPPISFGQAGAGAHHVELASKADFQTVDAAEDTAQAPLASDEVALGATYWREGSGASPGAKLEVRREPRRAGARSARNESVDDTGESSVILYQNEPPKLTLRWSAVQEAAAYHLVVARSANKGAPILDRTLQATELRLPGSIAREGSYVWSVTPVDAQGASLASAKDNALRLGFDNVVKGLSVRLPKQGARVADSLVATTGELELGATLKVNNQPAQINDNGVFYAEVALVPGENRIVYTLQSPGAPARIYVRTVVLTAAQTAKVATPAKKRRRARKN